MKIHDHQLKLTSKYNTAIREVETSRNICQANESNYQTEEKNFLAALNTLTESVTFKCQEIENIGWNTIDRLSLVSEDFGNAIVKYCSHFLSPARKLSNLMHLSSC